jgi:hypothetical protein
MAPGMIGEQVIQAWERGVGRPTVERTALALELMPPEDRPALPSALFARDAALMKLRISLFGSLLDAVARCPGCETEFDLPLDLSALAGAVPPAVSVSVDVNGFAAIVRPPTTQDLLELSTDQPPEAFAAALFLRCIEQATQRGRLIEPSALPPAIRTAAAVALSAQGMEGPSADLTCGACGHAWQAPIDIAGAVLRDIDAWVVRQLDEVHRIAGAYHWSERDILALSPARRQFYLEAIG